MGILQHITASPSRITEITRAALALMQFENKYITGNSEITSLAAWLPSRRRERIVVRAGRVVLRVASGWPKGLVSFHLSADAGPWLPIYCLFGRDRSGRKEIALGRDMERSEVLEIRKLERGHTENCHVRGARMDQVLA